MSRSGLPIEEHFSNTPNIKKMYKSTCVRHLLIFSDLFILYLKKKCIYYGGTTLNNRQGVSVQCGLLNKG